MPQPGFEGRPGKLTVAYGRNLEAVGIRQDEGEYLLHNDVNWTVDQLLTFVKVFASLSPVRQATLIDMAFNLGVPGLLKFEQMLAAVDRRNYEQAAHEMLDSLWARQTGGRASDLAHQMEFNQISG